MKNRKTPKKKAPKQNAKVVVSPMIQITDFAHLLRYKKITQAQLAVAWGTTERTVRNKLADPTKLRIDECDISQYTGVTLVDTIHLIMGKPIYLPSPEALAAE